MIRTRAWRISVRASDTRTISSRFVAFFSMNGMESHRRGKKKRRKNQKNQMASGLGLEIFPNLETIYLFRIVS